MNHPRAFATVANPPFIDLQPTRQDELREIMAGLQAPQKTVSPRFFYDKRGSALFEEITRLPEYYPSRTERQILTLHAEAIGKRVGSGRVIIEPGAGSCSKIRLLLDSLRPAAYWPLDISGSFVRQAALELRADFDWLPVTAVCADFNQLQTLAEHLPSGRKLAFYPGSTLGNLSAEAATRLLITLRGLVGADGGILLGLDLHKDEKTLNEAYNDSQGVTAAFNLNLLEHLNRLLPANFEPEQFKHLAFYDPQRRRIEMHLESLSDQQVTCAGETLQFVRGETIHTENSYKYSLDDLDQLLDRAGLQREDSWFDGQDLFGFHYCRPVL